MIPKVLKDKMLAKAKKNFQSHQIEKESVSADFADQSEITAAVIESEVEGAPSQYVVGYLLGVEQRDADSFVRGQMTLICSDLNNSGYRIKKHRSGYVYEIREGGRDSWLDDVVAKVEEVGEITIQVGTRAVRINADDTGIHSSLMPAKSKGLSFYQPKSSGKTLPFHAYVQRWILPAVGLFAVNVTFLAVVLSAIYQAEGDRRDRQIYGLQAKIDSAATELPIAQIPKTLPDGKHIARIEFKNGAWQPIVYADNPTYTPPVEVEPQYNPETPAQSAADSEIESMLRNLESRMPARSGR